MTNESRAQIARAVQFMEQQPEFVAFAFAEYRRAHNLSPAELAKHLGCEFDRYQQLALCLRPPGADPTFRQRVEKIAEHAGANAIKLIQLLREVETRIALRESDSGARLMAARHRPAEAEADADFIYDDECDFAIDSDDIEPGDSASGPEPTDA